MKKIWLFVIVSLVITGLTGIFWWRRNEGWVKTKVERIEEITDDIISKYDFDSLKSRKGIAGDTEWLAESDEIVKRRDNLSKTWKKEREDLNIVGKEYRFKSESKWISGYVNYINDGKKRSTILMVRGYADKPGYYPGSGSWKAADEFAKAGLNTVSIDFLGFGKSDEESRDMLEARFEKVPAVLDLLETIKTWDWVDSDRIGLWAHSNGGQITLSVLEITGGKYPTVLWAPMTQEFPRSVLETASDLDDGGRLVKEAIGNFLKRYDPRRYAFANYLDWVEAPILIQQGTNDVWCKVEWQEELVNNLKSLGKQAELVVYSRADHNLGGAWEEAIAKDIAYYKSRL